MNYIFYALKNHFKKILIFSIIIIVVFILIKRKRKNTKSFFKVFKNLPEKFPQAFIGNANGNFINSTNEEVCRNFLEKTFKLPFPKTRPSFLKNPTSGKSLELDCYCEKLKLACEYNGQQHYRFTPYFHKNYEAFLNQQFRDNLKKKLCKQNNIYLIEVPYYIENIEKYLTQKLIEWKTNKQKEK
jgi:hypothetical protein